MKKITILFSLMGLMFFLSLDMQAQKFFTREAKISFYSEAPLEKIEAVNGAGTCVIDFESQQMEFAVLIKAFQFDKALMQEHFNENYMESHKFPKATFKGKIVEPNAIDYKSNGEYDVTVEGKLTIHGVENEISAPGTIIINGEEIQVNSKFSVAVKDYDISIPAVVRDNIAKNVEITVAGDLEPLK
jgi:hypothetical protein